MSDSATCDCGVSAAPAATTNPPGRESLSYRVGDFVSFRRALLAGLPGEHALAGWHPAFGSQDLGLMLLEWWALVADILTFYNERAVHDAFLGTARDPESVRNLVRLLGYRPRPAVGARGAVAALVGAKVPLTVPAGLKVQSTPGPGEAPQIFETTAPTLVEPGGAIAARAESRVLAGRSLYVAGRIGVLPAGTRLLLGDVAPGASPIGVWLVVESTAPERTPDGQPVTRITFTSASPTLSGAIDGRHLYRPTRESGLCLLPAEASDGLVFTGIHAHLGGLVRDLAVGDVIALDDGSAAALTRVTAIGETVWYANASAATPGTAPTSNPLPLPHTVVNTAAVAVSGNKGAIRVRYGFTELAPLAPAVAASVTSKTTLTLAHETTRAIGSRVQIVDATGRGLVGTVKSATSVELDPPAGTAWQAPFTVLVNVLDVSRGATVAREVLGRGDATLTGQRFVLAKAPLTWLTAANGEPVSTLDITIDGIRWHEVKTLYHQAPGARVFVTQEDALGRTHVVFGDGVAGARLPSGREVVARYRYGAGRQAPGPGALATLATPLPGLTSVRGPVAPGGGADRDAPDAMKKLAPRSVLTFGRAVALDDYAVIARAVPGVARARAYVVWDEGEQRALVRLYVGDDTPALEAARSALVLAIDPTRPLQVLPAKVVKLSASVTVTRDPSFTDAVVVAGVKAALGDPERGLFALPRAEIGKAWYLSDVHQAVLAVPGVRAAEAQVRDANEQLLEGPRNPVGEGEVHLLAPDAITVVTTPEVTP